MTESAGQEFEAGLIQILGDRNTVSPGRVNHQRGDVAVRAGPPQLVGQTTRGEQSSGPSSATTCSR